MKFHKPKFWDKNGHISLFSILLLPLSLIAIVKNYHEKNKIKKNFYDLKTICVGNIYIGGTGKTPLVNNLANYFKKRFRTYIIKKNYSSHLDEKKLLESKHKVIFEKTRELSIKEAENKKAEMLIFDDGLQEKKINFDLSIACFNSTHTIGNGFLIPAGPLRESLFEIRNYDAVFLNGEKRNIKFQNKIKKINKNIKIFYANYKPTNLKSFNLKKNYLIFCGLGNPEEFEKTLINYKFKIKEKRFFPDHYNFSNKDINKIKSLAKEKKLEIVTSEKDYLRLDNSKKKNIKFIKVDLKISNQKKFESFLNKNL